MACQSQTEMSQPWSVMENQELEHIDPAQNLQAFTKASGIKKFVISDYGTKSVDICAVPAKEVHKP